MATVAAQRPAGRVTQVFVRPRDAQGAYDFLEGPHAKACAIGDAVAHASVRCAAALASVLVVVDGTSLEVADRGGRKGFGCLGSSAGATRGMKLINALAVAPDGTTIGLVDQQYWCRTRDPARTVRAGAIKKYNNRKRPTADKETQRWIDSITASECRFSRDAPHVRRIYVLDREADAHALLLKLASTGQGFVVRSCWDRVALVDGVAGKQYLRSVLAALPVVGHRELVVEATSRRAARTARFELRATELTLAMREGHGRGRQARVRVGVVQAREIGTTPAGEEPLEWTMLTNLKIDRVAAICAVFDHYALRWRVEDFHKTLKTGACNIESMQLRSPDAAIKWATILSAVAARIERLKHLARTSPELPASVELSDIEIRVLIVMKRDIRKKTESISDAMPTIATATLWLAQLGGYTGKSSGGPPGATTIRRGLEAIRGAAILLEALEARRSDQ